MLSAVAVPRSSVCNVGCHFSRYFEMRFDSELAIIEERFSHNAWFQLMNNNAVVSIT